MLDDDINDDEFLYRGLIPVFYQDRISSAAFKDSMGTSVDRDNLTRPESECVEELCKNDRFIGVCKIKSQQVREIGALPLYKYLEANPYHSEIHDSENVPQIKSSKARKLSRKAELVWLKNS